ncbi:NINE protein [Arthrobacter sp. 24S4-2]|uniref:TM2 domain-containing protein n=1 Tax=Arthrobacter sp. 24S4-2 TaxID=2575374 RepID=UPI0010C792F1|nr:TM2 domain-containing protein [Arthrobacter sp. 24S4-2]QCO98200.1 NINE protein [Arthrobacter sp. 24S4-2]
MTTPSEEPAAPAENEVPLAAQPAAPVAGPSAWNPPAVATPPVQSFDPPQPPMSAQQQSYPVAAPAQYQQMAPAPQHYQSYPPAPPQYPAPTAPQQFPGQYPQMSQQLPMPNPGYGYPQPKSRLAAGLLGIFLGGLGIHRFYLGYTTIGVIQIVLTVFLGVFTLGIVALWGLVEGIMILAGASYFQRDAKGIPLRD